MNGRLQFIKRNLGGMNSLREVKDVLSYLIDVVEDQQNQINELHQKLSPSPKLKPIRKKEEECQ